MKAHRSPHHCHSKRSETAAGRLSSSGKSLNSEEFLHLARCGERALRDVVRKVIIEHRQKRLPLAIWRNGKVVLIPANKVRLPVAGKVKR